MKYMEDWTFAQFVYKNYGFSVTRQQSMQAVGAFIRLSKKALAEKKST